MQQALIQATGGYAWQLSSGHFPEDVIELTAVRRLAVGGGISLDYFSPYPPNIAMLQGFFPYLVIFQYTEERLIHTLIQRMVTASGMERQALIAQFSPQLPPQFFVWQEKGRSNWMKDKVVPYYKQWVTAWKEMEKMVRIHWVDSVQWEQDPNRVIYSILEYAKSVVQ